jgi:hypothetical protein
MEQKFTRISKVVFSLMALFGVSNLFGQCPPGEVEVTIDVTTDTWGYEAYWELHPVGNSCGSASAVFVGGNPAVGCGGGGAKTASATDPGAYASNTTITEGPWCLVDGADYVVHEVDDWGDGATVYSSPVGFSYVAPGDSSTFTFTANAALANNLTATQIFNADSTDYGYTKIPVGQIRPIGMSVDIQNTGLNNATNATFSYDINDGTSSVAAGASGAVANIVAGGGDTLSYLSSYTPAASAGSYTLTAVISSDSVDLSSSDDTITSSLEVTDYIWAKDYYNSAADVDGGFVNISINSGQPVSIGHLFMASANQTAHAINFGVYDISYNENSVFYAQLYEWDGAGGAFIMVANSLDYSVVAGDLGNIVRVDFITPYELISGSEYLAVVGHYGLSSNGTDGPVISAAGNGVEGDVLGFYGATNDLYSLIAPGAYVVRLNMEDISGISESDMNFVLGQNQPNPFNNTTLVNYTLNEASTVSFKVVDYTGKIVMESFEGTKSAGDHSINLNADNLANGVYYYTLSTERGSLTKTMVVTK